MGITDKIGVAIYNSEGRSFFEERSLDSRNAQLVRAQTMHDVFYVSGNNTPGVYIKLAKAGRDGKPDKKEMDIEARWYNIFRNELGLLGAPLAVTFPIDGNYALAVEEVPGKTCDNLFRQIAAQRGVEGLVSSQEFGAVLERSAEISARGYLLHLKEPERTPVFFRGADGGFDAGEFDFLNGRTVKIMAANGRETKHLIPLLAALKEELTAPGNRAFYRDATPLNWIMSDQGVVAIDLGSTSYRPPQFELIALIETPDTGIDGISKEERGRIIREHRRLLAGHGLTVASEKEFERNYLLANLVKQSSGVASRIEHIARNNAMIASQDVDQQSIGRDRLEGNIAGKRFHARKAIEAINSLGDYFNSNGLKDQADAQREIFEAEL